MTSRLVVARDSEIANNVSHEASVAMQVVVHVRLPREPHKLNAEKVNVTMLFFT